MGRVQQSSFAAWKIFLLNNFWIAQYFTASHKTNTIFFTQSSVLHPWSIEHQCALVKFICLFIITCLIYVYVCDIMHIITYMVWLLNRTLMMMILFKVFFCFVWNAKKIFHHVVAYIFCVSMWFSLKCNNELKFIRDICTNNL